jgi:hypothetical protein
MPCPPLAEIPAVVKSFRPNLVWVYGGTSATKQNIQNQAVEPLPFLYGAEGAIPLLLLPSRTYDCFHALPGLPCGALCALIFKHHQKASDQPPAAFRYCRSAGAVLGAAVQLFQSAFAGLKIDAFHLDFQGSHLVAQGLLDSGCARHVIAWPADVAAPVLPACDFARAFFGLLRDPSLTVPEVNSAAGELACLMHIVGRP